MMKKNVFYLWLLMLSLFSATIVSCEEEESFEDVPGASDETWQSVEEIPADADEFNFTFTAATAWTAASSQSSWCTVTPSGSSGRSVLKVKVQENTTGQPRTSRITLAFNGYEGVAFDVTQKAGGADVEEPSGDLKELNGAIDEFLARYYLWNDEYGTMTRDLTLPYTSDYNNFFVNTLGSMTTNILDLKSYGGTQKSLYSYITRTPSQASAATRATGEINHDAIEKGDPINSFGIVQMGGISFIDENGNLTGEYALAVMGVYPNSPAVEGGLARGDIIYKVNGRAITEATLNSDYLSLLYPTQNEVEVTLYETGTPVVALTSTLLDPTPILAHEVWEEGGARIGYLHYMSFDAAYDNDLLNVIKEFNSAGINELILDLRYNGGGHVISANMLSTCIAGQASDGKVFQYYRYNDTRMAAVEDTQRETGMVYDPSAKYFYEGFDYNDYYGAPLKNYALGLSRVYVLTTFSTASASELVINSLRGIGLDVVTIGETSNGKNVGMEVAEFTYGGYDYEMAPITFQTYNSQLQSINPSGIVPDEAVSDYDEMLGYVDFGKDEPLIAAALAKITGVQPAATTRTAPAPNFRRSTAALPRHASIHPEGAIVLLPKKTE